MKTMLRAAIAGIALFAAAPTALAAPDAPRTLRDLAGPMARPAIVPKDAVLIIIDAQNEYRSGALKLEAIDPAITEIVRLRKWAIANAIPVIHVRHEAPAGSAIFAAGSNGAAIMQELTPAAGEEIVVKTFPNAFVNTNMEQVLTKLGRHSLIVTGFMTHMCVDATTRAAFDRGFQVTIVASATADRAIPGPDGQVVPADTLRRVSLTALNDTFAWVVATADVLMADTPSK